MVIGRSHMKESVLGVYIYVNVYIFYEFYKTF
jgi:hypothetical protein